MQWYNFVAARDYLILNNDTCLHLLGETGKIELVIVINKCTVSQ